MRRHRPLRASIEFLRERKKKKISSSSSEVLKVVYCAIEVCNILDEEKVENDDVSE